MSLNDTCEKKNRRRRRRVFLSEVYLSAKEVCPLWFSRRIVHLNVTDRIEYTKIYRENLLRVVRTKKKTKKKAEKIR